MEKVEEYDLWGAAPARPYAVRDYLITNEVTKSRTIRPSRGLPVPDAKRAVSYPHPGQSVNPRPEDHEAAVAIAEEKLLKREARLQHYESQYKKRRGGQGGGMGPGQGQATDDNATDGVASEAPGPPSKPSRRKTTKERKKILERKLKEVKEDRREKQYQLDKDTGNIVKYKRELAAKEAERAAIRAVRKKKIKYGKHVVVSSALDVLEAAPGTLRAAEGGAIHPIQDRYESFQRRGIIEATRPMVRKQRKIARARWSWKQEGGHRRTEIGRRSDE